MSKLAEEQEVERLFGLGPESFVAARNEAARRLRREGDAGAAARVTALRRPSMSAWAVNQLARGRGPELEGLLEVGGRLRAAHRAAVAGGGADALRAATRAEREAVAGLLAAAVEVLESTGHATTEATRDRIAATLHAAAADPAAAELVRRGRLTHDLDPAGFGTPDAAPEEAVEGEAGGVEPGVAAGRRRATRATSGGRDVAASRRGDGKAAVDEEAVAAARARRLAAVAARDAARRRARLAADQAVLATRHAERLGRLADQAEREAARARTTASAAIDAAAAARERASRAAKELTEAEGRLADDG
ncbi:MAG TPA: hypothetical protein VFU54_11720 [Actinomycetota bacterium]|nr:hypothetical protein [Actinomycetota bacterium]